MNARATLLTVALGTIIASCREKPASKPNQDPKVSQEQHAEKEAERSPTEKEAQPREDEIAEHCVAFLRATKMFPAQSPGADCPGCSGEGTEVLSFQAMKTDRISCADETCQVAVTIRATFKPGSGATMTGGLTGWIPQDQRTACLSGHPPAGEQLFRVKIVYKRKGETWRAIDFDRADSGS